MSKPANKPGLNTLWPIIRKLSKYKLRLVAAMIALLFTAGMTLGLGRGLQMLIDQGFSQGLDGLSTATTVLMLLCAGMVVGTFIRFYLVSWLGERVSADLRTEVFDNIVTLHPGYFEENRSGEIMSRLTTDTTLLQTIIGSSFSMALRSSITTTGALIMMFITNLKLSLIVTCGVPLVILPIILFGRRVRSLSTDSQSSIANVGTYAGEIIRNIRTVQGYNQQPFESTAFAGEVERAFNIAKRRIRQRSLLICAAMLLLFFSMGGMIWQGGSDVINGVMTAGELGAFVFYAVMVGSGFATIAEVWGDLQRAAGAAERLLDLLATPSALKTKASSAIVDHGEHLSIQFQNVNFAYPTRPNLLALNQFNLAIEAGKSLALVGPSGAGKSTVFELLQRFYDPQSGTLLFNQTDSRDISLEQLRGMTAVVPQQPALFTADVRYNIAYGSQSASDEAIVAAAKAANAHEFIMALPEGYQSHLGEQGVRLSGGQRQRIALARAILNDAKILLLDEATSALDAESEHQVQLALQNLQGERTTVIIAHRLATVLHADTIAVMENGRVIDSGNHSSLLKTCSLYARLAAMQFRQSTDQLSDSDEALSMDSTPPNPASS